LKILLTWWELIVHVELLRQMPNPVEHLPDPPNVPRFRLSAGLLDRPSAYAEHMSNDTRAMIDLISRVRRFTDMATERGRVFPTGIKGLVVAQERTPTPLDATMYNPVVCLILQGAKELVTTERRVICRQGQSVIVSHDTPVASRITNASYDAPYLAMTLQLDPAVLRSLIDDLADPDTDEPLSTSIQVGETDDELLDGMSRLFALRDGPRDAAVLGPLISREIHYRLLKAEHGASLRRLVRRNGQAARISNVITAIRTDLSERLSIPELARQANMSPSTFHQHFKTITEMTPLQYQKQLRLLEARRLLAEGDQSVSNTAYAVGYRSVTQFSREYARTFGTPPRDTARLGAITPEAMTG
jgi:AraC-like DNA-binding protein